MLNRMFAGGIAVASLLVPGAASAQFTKLDPPPAPHVVRLSASSTAQTVALPGHAANLHIVALSENGHRFQFSHGVNGGVIAYGGGVTLKVVERSGARYFATAVSVTGTAHVRVAYTLGH